LGVKPAAGDIVASNGYTVTIDENVNVDSITNTAQLPVSIIPLMTSNTAPEGVASSNNIFGIPSYDAFKAFDRSVGGAPNHWLTANNPVLPWLEYQFSSPKIIVAYSLENNFNNLPNTWQFQAWNGSAWVVLDTVTGNTSNSYQTRTFTNTTAYTRYRIYITAVNGTNAAIGELRMFDVAADAAIAVAGGGFVVSSSVTITCTSITGMQPGPATLLTVSATSGQTVNVNSNLTNSSTANGVNVISKTGSCTLNIVGDSVRLAGSGSSRHGLVVFSPGTINFVGNVLGHWSGSHGILMTTGSAGAVLNVVGNINPNKFGPGGAQNAQYLVVNTVCTINVTGNIYGGFGNDAGISVGAAATIYVTGNVYGGQSSGAIGSGAGIVSAQSHFLSVIGTIFAQHTVPFETSGVHSTSSGAINLFSGPFVAGPYGSAPITCVRMHLIPNAASYFEFRDETTNGAISPGAIAPATQLVSPATIADNPIPADVRLGTVYSLGTQTGTLHMPHPNQVSYGIPVDNTFGNAVLSMSDIWNVQSSTLTTNGSIGQRLKNASTVESTGDQLSAFS
jgi:hypothetical protein